MSDKPNQRVPANRRHVSPLVAERLFAPVFHAQPCSPEETPVLAAWVFIVDSPAAAGARKPA